MSNINTFNIELIKGYTRTTSANRANAVQMIASGVSGKDCKANAVAAYTICKELLGVDKGTLGIYKALGEMPESVWRKYPLAQQDTPEGVKQANQLVRLAQAFMLCNEAGVGYATGYAVGFTAGHDEHKEAEEKDSVADNAADNADSEDDSDDSEA